MQSRLVTITFFVYTRTLKTYVQVRCNVSDSSASKWSTQRISKETLILFQKAALEKEAFWQTADRVIKEYLVTRLKKE